MFDKEFSIMFINYSTLNNEHNHVDICVQLRHQQTNTFDNHN